MKYIICIILILLLPAALAQQSYNTYQSLTIDTNVKSTTTVEGSGLQYLEAELYLNPKNDNIQNILQKQILSNPQAEITDNEFIKYRWDSQSPEYDLELDARIQTTNKLFPVSKIDFPLQDLPEEYEQHLREQDIIDITPEIIAKSSEIVGSEDNAYLAVHKIGYWINNNIEYRLDTLTEKASRKASWVLDNKYGVCDEISILFISMVRSIGIPARFISGTAYTNVGDYFGNHGWAEVYYPGYGWVPYDITYGQFGWIDPSHISLSKTVDAAESTIKYKWVASGTEIVPGGIETNTEVISTGNEINPIFDLRIKPIENDLGPGSYVPVRVTIENPRDKYLSTQISITKAPAVEGKNTRVVALRPNEQKQEFWIFKLPDDIDEGYIYTSTIEAKDTFGSVDQDEITYSTIGEVLSLEEVQEIIDGLQEEQEQSYSDTVYLSCKPEKEYYYAFEQAKIECTVRSISNALSNLNLCLNDQDCQQFSLDALQEKQIVFTKPAPEIQETSKVTLLSTDLNLARHLTINVYDGPDIQIFKIDYPEEIDYNMDTKIDIELHSHTQIKDPKIKINSMKYIDIDEFKGEKSISINFNSQALFSEKLNIQLKYKDEYGSSYQKEFQFPIKVNNVPWYAKIYGFFIELFN